MKRYYVEYKCECGGTITPTQKYPHQPPVCQSCRWTKEIVLPNGIWLDVDKYFNVPIGISKNQFNKVK